jgi:hypothetical protein
MLLMASKVPACAELARGAVQQQGMCVVIGLQSTGEANMNAVRAPTRCTTSSFKHSVVRCGSTTDEAALAEYGTAWHAASVWDNTE